ncbi:hypothetical protein Lesp02_13340 [Lentzea sp. NBRC 105346]|uniref:hypothetical protein n=1 Tax=Lentzea sp. NBRC 105346 TaxID=3032205 RepID=UPI0024A28834|nr:hypothetical protein [Lentzea sp. NBRC 105346]GLZ29144.1 hypothetical protein Lesp02_13340 [Lentzea sp. NBRC 105346]
MNWSSYEIFSILSGVSLLAAVFFPDVKPKDRALCAAGGLFFLIYGFYVANQTTGTWTFPWVIFVIPFGAVAYLGYTIAKRKGYFDSEADD